MLFMTAFILGISLLLVLASAKRIEKEAVTLSVGVILLPDVLVYDDVASLNQIGLLPLGSFVIYKVKAESNTNSNKKTNTNRNKSDGEMILVKFPYNGYVTASAISTATNQAISSLPLWDYLSQLYSAGKGVLGAQSLSVGWVDQWPVGTGAIGERVRVSAAVWITVRVKIRIRVSAKAKIRAREA
jgi:hypothetical protein